MNKTVYLTSSLFGIVLLVVAAAGAYKFNVLADDVTIEPQTAGIIDRLPNTAGFMMTTSDGAVMAQGILSKPQVTTWMYGSYQLAGFALNSDSVLLDGYLGKAIIVIGKPVAGYPVENGPYLLDVQQIQLDQKINTDPVQPQKH